MDGIKTKELDTIKAHILGNPTIRCDFDACVNLYKDYILQSTSSTLKQVLVSAVNSGKKWDDVQPDMSVEDRYYKQSEYSALSNAQKKGLSLKRGKRGHPSSGKGGDKGKGKRIHAELSKKTIKAVRKAAASAAIAAVKSKCSNEETSSTTGSDSDSADDDDVDADKSKTKNTNRNNKALKRKKG